MSTQNKERLAYDMKEFRTETREEGEGLPDLVGHAAVFDKEVTIRGFFGDFIESIAPGAFKDSLERKDDVRALFNHDPNHVLGRTESGTLELREDDVGLHSRISPPDTQLGRDLTELVSRGDISQMSFGFVVKREEVEDLDDEDSRVMFKRRILEAELFDVSPVTFPAFDMTDIGVEQNFRSAEDIYNSVRDKMGKKDADLIIEAAYRSRRAALSRVKSRYVILDVPAKFSIDS